MEKSVEKSITIKPTDSQIKSWLWLLGGLFLLALLYLSSNMDYLLFHSLVELFSVVVAAGIFMMAWNSRAFFENHYLLFLGIAYLFVGAFDLLHTLAYKGMGVFPGYGTDLATQIWVAARYLEALSFLVAPLFITRKKFHPALVFGIFGGITVLTLASIFYFHTFPAAYIDGSGLTVFKVTSEYIISLFLLGAAYLLYLNRATLDHRVYRLLLVSLFVTVGSEMAFTLYTDPYGISNVIGHLLKVISFYLVYRALVVTGMQEPYRLLFRNLKASEEAARKNETKYRQLFTHMAGAFALHRIITDDTGRPIDYEFIEVNEAFEKMTGLSRSEIMGKRVTAVLPGIEKDPADWIGRYGLVALGLEKELKFEQYSEGLKRWYAVTAYSPKPGHFAAIFEDVTERKRAQEKIAASEKRLRHTLDHMLEGCQIISPDGRYLYVNEAAARQGRIPRKKYRGHTMAEFYPGIENSPLFAALRKCHKEQTSITMENEFEYPDGDKGWFELSLQPVPEGVFILSVDITNRRRVEEKIRNLALFPEQNPYPVLRVTSNGILEFANHSSKRLLETWDCRVGQPLPEAVRHRVALALGTQRIVQFEADCGQLIFSLSITPVPSRSYVNIYGLDITERKKAEEKLQYSQNRYRELVQNANSAIIRWRTDGTITFFNEYAQNFFGYQTAEIIGQSVNLLVPETGSSGNDLKALVRDIAAHPENFQYNINENIRRDGSRVWMAWTNKPIFDERGQVEEILAIGSDITAPKIAEEALRQAEERYRTVANYAYDWETWIRPDGSYKYVSPSMERITGYRAEELIADPSLIEQIIHPDDLDRWHAHRHDTPDKTAVKPDLREFEFRIITRDGQARWIQHACLPVRDKAGNFLGYRGSNRDITELKTLENQLRDHAALIDLANDTIIVFDLDSNVLFWNHGATRRYGYLPQDVAGRNIHSLLKTEFPLPRGQILAELEQSGEWQGELRQTTHSGSHIVVDSRWVLQKGKDGKPDRIMEINLDITERKKTEEQIERYNRDLARYARELQHTNNELEAFTYSVSHDLRAPLRAIDGFSQALIEDYPDSLDERGRDYLDRVRKGSQKMARLIDDLLRLSRLSRQELSVREFDLSQLAEETAAEITQANPERHIRLAIEPDITTRADRSLLKIALTNLLGNAWKYTASSEPAVIEFGKVPGSGHSTFFVKDNGQGFKMEYASKLFQPFHRLPGSEKFSGTGIGLAITSRIITRHGGRIWAEAEENKGATFFFTI